MKERDQKVKIMERGGGRDLKLKMKERDLRLKMKDTDLTKE